jgi:hypothetical protein
MAVKKRPRMQHQGPDWRCKHNTTLLGWVSCTAYSMAMGIDASTVGGKRPTGCEVRMHTGDFVKGLTLSQVAAVAEATYGVEVRVRTGKHTIAPDKAWEQASLGRGFVLQGNCDALVATPFRSTKGAVNHAVWVNRVRGGTPGHPKKEARVFDPAADGRHAPWGTACKGPSWWPWETVLAFAAGLRNDSNQKLGPGKMYAGFVPKPKPGASLMLAAGAKKTTPFPDRQRANPPAGHRVNVRSDPHSLDPNQIVDRLSDGMLFVAFQRLDGGAKPPGASSVWYGNEDGSEWIHESGLRQIGGPTITLPGGIPVIAADLGDEDIIIGAELLQADIFEGTLAPEEFTFEQLQVNPDMPVPEEGDDVDGDDEADDVDEQMGWARAAAT